MIRSILKTFPIRGPKKGKSADTPKIQLTSDVINIFKDRTDPQVKPLSEYPPWLSKVLAGPIHPTKLYYDILNGKSYELDDRDQRRLLRWIRKAKINYKRLSKPPDFHFYPAHHDSKYVWGLRLEEDSDDDPEDHLEIGFRLSRGGHYLDEINIQMRRLKDNLDKV